MAKDQLRVAALAALTVAGGAVAEATALPASHSLAAADFLTGCVCALAGARLARSSLGVAWVLVGLGVLWFAGTAAGEWASGPAPIVTAALLAYRVPLIAIAWHLRGSGGRYWLLGATAICCGAIALPLTSAGVVTAGLLAIAAARSSLAGRTYGIDGRTPLVTRSLAAAALAAVWLASAFGAAGAGLETGNDVLVSLFVVAVAWPMSSTRSRGVAGAVVIELGPAADAVTPVVTRLRRMLADDDLQVRFQTSALTWVDDAGRAAQTPDLTSPRTTQVTTARGAVVLLHGAHAAVRPDLSSAAASVCGLARDRVDIDAEARRQSALVAASRRRLLEAADDERRALAAELRRGPLATLRQVDELLRPIGTPVGAELRAVLLDAVDDLVRLGHGLYPAAVSGAELEPALRGLAGSAPLDVAVDVLGDVAKLSAFERALVWFCCSECLTNVVRHAKAKHVAIRCEVARTLTVSVTDDGAGGATVGGGQGLRGLADRLETAGGQLSVNSPPGGPTVVVATVALTHPPS